jgi:hypothetical protein
VLHELTAMGAHIEVDGDAPIRCELPAGPTRLLNVLVREEVEAQVGQGACSLPIRFVFAIEGLPWLEEGHAAVFDPPEVAALSRRAVWLR